MINDKGTIKMSDRDEKMVEDKKSGKKSEKGPFKSLTAISDITIFDSQTTWNEFLKGDL